MKTSVLLINLGTPDSPKTADVRKYLREFLNDRRVINIPWLWRKLLVNLVIVPFRSIKSAKLYSRIWTTEGSPLLTFTKKLRDALRVELNDTYEVEMAMRYGNPSLNTLLKQLEKQHPERIILIPLYPQYASSTSGSTLEMAFKLIGKWKNIPEVKFVHHFHDYPGFINAYTQRINQYNPKSFDHIIMSYHGLPLSHIHDAHVGNDCEVLGCSYKRDDYNNYCYLASCYETSRLLAESLNLTKEKYTVSFQSRLSKNWTKPFTDEVIKDLVTNGKKRILVISPSFVTDCLETVYELGEELKDEFEKNGGDQFTLVESLNELDFWVHTISKMVVEA